MGELAATKEKCLLKNVSAQVQAVKPRAHQINQGKTPLADQLLTFPYRQLFVMTMMGSKASIHVRHVYADKKLNDPALNLFHHLLRQ